MPANVETMFYVGQTPWHGLGQKLTAAPTVAEAIKAAGLDWEVGLAPLFMQDGTLVEEALATIRKSDNKRLGVVGPRYRPLQNDKAFDWFQPWVDSNSATLHTAGSLNDGRKVWVLAQLNSAPSEIVKGDEVAKFVLLSNSHDGTCSIRAGFTPIRVVCANTLASAHNAASSKLLRIRHTESSEKNLETVREIMNLANQEFEATVQQYRFLASKNFKQKDVEKYVRIFLDIPEETKTEEIKTRSKNIMEGIVNRIVSGEKQALPGVRGTWWAAYNGVTEYLNYEYGRNDSNRLRDLWFDGADNKKALDTALELAQA